MNNPALLNDWKPTYHTHIDEIPEGDWNNCAGTSDPFVQHQHLYALERSGIVSPETGFKPQHIVLRDNTGLAIAAAPAYLKFHSKGELGVDIGLSMAHERAVGPYYPKLQVEVPFTPISGNRLLVRPGVNLAAAYDGLVSALKVRATEFGASSVQISYMSVEESIFTEQCEFFRTEGNAYVWTAEGVGSINQFFGKMRSAKRSKFLSERRKATSLGLNFQTFSKDEINSDMAPKFFDLYKSTFERNATTPWLNLEYFEILFDKMANFLEVTIANQQETWIAVQLDIITPKIRFAQHWGHRGGIPFLLFEMGLYQTIEQAIAANQEKINSGTTGLHKSERGFGMEPTYHTLWFAEPAFREIAEIGLTRKRESAEQERVTESARLPFRKSNPDQEIAK